MQALPLLKSRFPIERARMRLKLAVPLTSKDELLDLVRKQGGVLEEQDLYGTGAAGGGGGQGRGAAVRARQAGREEGRKCAGGM